MAMKCRLHSVRRAMLISLLTAPLYLGTCAEIAIRVSINSVFDAADPYLVDVAQQAGQAAGEAAGVVP